MSLTKLKYSNEHALNLFQEIAKCLPDLKLSTVIEAEEKFHLADGNKDGVSIQLLKALKFHLFTIKFQRESSTLQNILFLYFYFQL